MPRVRSATARDAEAIRALLERYGLPTTDLPSAQTDFIVVYEGARLIGTGALQRFGAAALVRSVAVEASWHRSGIGRVIVEELERRARAADVTELVLLTQTAQAFFERHNYRAIDREKTPGAVRASEEFRSLCPASATCMSKTLVPPAPLGRAHG